MIELIAAGAAAALIVLSLRANARLRAHARLPMQWSLSGDVTWTAPRVVALGFTPALGIVVLAAAGASSRWLEPRPGQEGLVIPALLMVAGTFVAVHGLHLWMIERSLRRR